MYKTFRLPVSFDIKAASLDEAIEKLHQFFSNHAPDQHDNLPKDTVDYLFLDEDFEEVSG